MRQQVKKLLICIFGGLYLASGVLGLIQTPAPLSVWGTGSILGSKTHFESVQASKVLQDLLSLASGESFTPASSLNGLLNLQAGQRAPVDAVVIFVSSREDQSLAASQIEGVVRGSWLQLPNAIHQGQSNHIFKGVQHAAPRANLQVLGSCTGAPAVLPATADSIQQSLTAVSGGGSGPAVVVVCAEGPPEEESRLLAEAQAAVAALADKFLMVHTVGRVPSWSAQAEQLRRLLQEGGDSQYTCDARCQTQVKFLEGFIVLITVALALGVGLCCMHVINTPTRFETPKDHRGSQHQE